MVKVNLVAFFGILNAVYGFVLNDSDSLAKGTILVAICIMWDDLKGNKK